MKKLFVTLLAMLAFSMMMPAQNVEFSEDCDLAFGNEVFVVEPISYMGFGYQLKSADPDKAGFSDEFFINAMELGFRPFSNALIAIGVDYKLDTYRQNKNYFWAANDNGNVISYPASTLPGSAQLKAAKLRVHTFSIPLSFELNAGKSSFRIGAAGEYNLPAVAKYKMVSEGETKSVKGKGTGMNEFTYSAFGSISYGGLGVYVRYRPSFQFEEGKGPHFNNLVVGLAMGLGM